jgi:hypothetical protein
MREMTYLTIVTRGIYRAATKEAVGNGGQMAFKRLLATSLLADSLIERRSKFVEEL